MTPKNLSDAHLRKTLQISTKNGFFEKERAHAKYRQKMRFRKKTSAKRASVVSGDHRKNRHFLRFRFFRETEIWT